MAHSRSYGAYQLEIQCHSSRDIDTYREAFRDFETETIEAHFHLLREVTTLFIVAPDNLRLLVKEGNFAMLSEDDLEALIRQRADYKQVVLGQS